MNRRPLLSLLTVVFVLAASPVAARMTTAEPDFFEFQDGAILDGSNYEADGGLYDFEALRVPAGKTLYFSSDIIIQANDILIEGKLLGIRPTTAGANGPSLLMRAASTLIVYGTVMAGDGVHGASATTDGTAVGQRGGNGGDLRLEANGLTPFHLGATGLVGSGNAGNGGSATAYGLNTLGDTAKAEGGDGGNGGRLAIAGPGADLFGKLGIGNSGAGGAAHALYPGGATIAYGGASGSVGVLAVPNTISVDVLANGGTLIGGEDKVGGTAVAISLCVSVYPYPEPCPSGSPPPVERQGPAGADGADATEPGAAGEDGKEGGEAIAIAGDAGTRCVFGHGAPDDPDYLCVALYGADGGAATSYAGDGGRGGRGGDALTDSLTTLLGGPGGRGGTGGFSVAVAGNHSCAHLGCGNDGEIYARSFGGAGGVGGTGGYGPLGQVSCDVVGECLEVPDVGRLCGHAGIGLGGAPGRIVVERTAGINDPYYVNKDGRWGANVTGAYLDGCTHTGDHAHV